jgi:asparagine synthase (glutamine-hydrolysing)
MDPQGNILLHGSFEEAAAAVRSGQADRIRKIAGQFAIAQRLGKTIRMARSIGRPMRFFLAKRAEGPCLIIAERIDEIYQQLATEGLEDQFHPSYTRMVPAHHLMELQLVGCPDPNPGLTRFFAPPRNRLPADVAAIGERYVQQLAAVCRAWLDQLDPRAPIGVLFSGGIDSGALVILRNHLLLERGEAPQRLKAFTLAVAGGGQEVAWGGQEDAGRGEDVEQAIAFLRQVGLEMLLEICEVPRSQVDWRAAVRAIEDYKTLDVQAATMGLTLCRAIRERYPDWRYLIDGDGGDENLKDYPIEENPELTVRSVLGNRMLYQEGWGVDAVKHSLVYSGGQSRGHVRTAAPARLFGFTGFSPYATPDVIEVAEAIPFVELTDWDHQRLYQLKGQVVAAGIRAVTGVEMPVFEKRRFQQGAVTEPTFDALFPPAEASYRTAFQKLFSDPAQLAVTPGPGPARNDRTGTAGPARQP